MIDQRLHQERRDRLERISVLSADHNVYQQPTEDLAREIEAYISSFAAKRVAINRIKNRRLTPADPDEVARALDLRHLSRSDRHGRWGYIPKTYGGYRKVSSLSLALRVGQAIGRDLIVAMHRPGRHIAAWRGRGVNYHIARLIEDLSGDREFIVSVDVRDCFGSVNPDSVYEFRSLPPDFVESCLDPRRIRLRAPSRNSFPSGVVNGECVPIGMPACNQTAPPGLLTGGSASPALWSVMIDDLPANLPDGVRANTCSDNIAVVCRSIPECARVEAALSQYFSVHPAGPFELHVHRASLHDGFSHFGYNFDVRDGLLDIWPRARNLERIQAQMERCIRADLRAGRVDLIDAVGKALASYPFLGQAAVDAITDQAEIYLGVYSRQRRVLPLSFAA